MTKKKVIGSKKKKRPQTKAQKIKKLLGEAKYWQETILELKVAYQEMDRITEELLSLNFEQDKKLGIEMADNFDGSNRVYRAHGIRRFELRFA